MNEKKTIFVYRTDRLISRIRHMIYAWRFGRKVDAHTVMLWLPTTRKYIPDDGSDFDIGLLFDQYELNTRPDLSDLTILNGKTRISNEYPAVKDVLELDPTRTEEQTKKALYRFGDTFITDDLVGYRFNDEPRRELLADLSKHFKSLPVEPSIANRLDEVSRQLSDSPYTVVHVRRGDVMRVLKKNLQQGDVGNDDLQQFLKRTAPIDLYLSKIEENKVLDDGLVLLSSDDPNVAAELQSRIGKDKCKLISDFPFEGYKIQRDFFDFLMFVRAKRLIGTRASVYGKYASIFGGSQFIGVDFKPTAAELERYFDTEVSAGLDIRQDVLTRTKKRLMEIRAAMMADV